MPSNNPQTDKLFVYGTLQRGFDPHKYLQPTHFLGKGRIGGRLYDLGDYPGAVPSNLPGDFIQGELYELGNTDSQLRTLDEYEEFDPKHPEQSLFVRRQADVVLENGESYRAWVYFLPKKPAKARLIRGGDYTSARAGH